MTQGIFHAASDSGDILQDLAFAPEDCGEPGPTQNYCLNMHCHQGDFTAPRHFPQETELGSVPGASLVPSPAEGGGGSLTWTVFSWGTVVTGERVGRTGPDHPHFSVEDSEAQGGLLTYLLRIMQTFFFSRLFKTASFPIPNGCSSYHTALWPRGSAE